MWRMCIAQFDDKDHPSRTVVTSGKSQVTLYGSELLVTVPPLPAVSKVLEQGDEVVKSVDIVRPNGFERSNTINVGRHPKELFHTAKPTLNAPVASAPVRYLEE